MQKDLHNIDKYSEFRKAFTEGKVIQHRINVWVDMKQPIFVDYKQYRIKPNQKDLHETPSN